MPLSKAASEKLAFENEVKSSRSPKKSEHVKSDDSISNSMEKDSTKKKKMYLSIGVLLVLVLVLVLVLTVFQSSKDSSSSVMDVDDVSLMVLPSSRPTSSPSSNLSSFYPSSFPTDPVPSNLPSVTPTSTPTEYPSLHPTYLPTVKPTMKPSLRPTLSNAPSASPTLEKLQLMRNILSKTSELSLLDDPSTSQGKALQWMVYDDEAELDLESPSNEKDVTQRYVAVLLYFSTNSDISWLSEDEISWTNTTDWLTKSNVCKWHGIVCTKLALENFLINDNMMMGKIPSELFVLPSLKTIEFSTNQLTGSIPTEIGQASLLKKIDLSSNQLDGLIPTELGLLQELTSLELHQNAFKEISMPDEICDLKLENPAFDELSSDCLASLTAPDVNCTCCTICYE